MTTLHRIKHVTLSVSILYCCLLVTMRKDSITSQEQEMEPHDISAVNLEISRLASYASCLVLLNLVSTNKKVVSHIQALLKNSAFFFLLLLLSGRGPSILKAFTKDPNNNLLCDALASICVCCHLNLSELRKMKTWRNPAYAPTACSALGVGLSCLFIPLDSGAQYERWPIALLLGSHLGFLVGGVVEMVFNEN